MATYKEFDIPDTIIKLTKENRLKSMKSMWCQTSDNCPNLCLGCLFEEDSEASDSAFVEFLIENGAITKALGMEMLLDTA